MSEADRRIRTAIFGSGFGRIGHFDALRTFSEFEVVALAGGGFSSKDASRVYGSQEWMRVFSENSLDLVVISVPPGEQTKILLESLNRGLSVMVEKPLCLSEDELGKIQQQHQLTKNLSISSFEFPELETWKRALTIVRDSGLGNLRTMYIDWKMESKAIQGNQKNWKTQFVQGGSALFHFLPHLLHTTILFTEELKEVSCVSLPAPDLSDEMGLPICSIQIRTVSGIFVNINCSLAAPSGSGQSIEINGSEGTLILENRGSDYVKGYKLSVRKRHESFEFLEAEINPLIHHDKFRSLDSRTVPLASLYRKFLDARASQGLVQPSLADAIEVQKLVFLCQKSNQEKKWISV